jgi:DNA-binding transcriptional LysR family regulator
MDLNAVKLFVQAAQAGSISEAARQTGIPLPTFSRQLRRLEEHLQVRLLDRGPRGLGLTAAGTQLLADASPALASLGQAQQRLYDSSGVAGVLRLSLPPHLEPLWGVFRSFCRRYPLVNLDIFVTDRRVDLVADGIDVAIRVGDRGSAAYVGRTLTRYRHRLVASPQFLSEHPIRQPSDVTTVPVACWRTRSAGVWALGGQEIELRPFLITNDYTHLLHLALAKDALVEVPPFLARDGIRDGRLVEVLPEHPLPEETMRALVVERRAMSPVVRQFLDDASVHVGDALAG